MPKRRWSPGLLKRTALQPEATKLEKKEVLYMTLKRGLALATIIAIIGVVGCTTTAPFIISFTGLPATMNVGQTATLTATGNPGSTQGLWTWTFAASSGCGTFSGQNPVGPTNSTTVTVTFTAGSVGGSCTVTVTLTTAAGRSASASQTTTITGLLPLRGWFYVKDGTIPRDSVISLNGTIGTSCSDMDGAECDDDDGASYTNFPPTGGGSGLNSVIAGHPLASGTNTLQVVGFGGGDIGPHDLYIHITGGTGTEFNESEPNDSIGTATSIPPLPTCSEAYSAAPGANPQKPGTPYTQTLPGVAAPGNWVAHGQISPGGNPDYYGPITVTTTTTIVVWVDGSPDTVGGPHDHDFPPDALDGVINLLNSSGISVLGIPSTPAAAEGGKPADPLERIAAVPIDGGFNTDSANAEAFSVQVGPGTYYILVSGFGGETHAYDMTACKF
jgi:hypothetical protein